MLDENYIPMGSAGGEPKPPRYPTRLKALIYAFSRQCFEDDVKMAGGKIQQKKGG